MNSLFTEISLEKALEIIEELKEPSVFESTGATVHTGEHETYGAIHIVIPIAGLSILMVAQNSQKLPADPLEKSC